MKANRIALLAAAALIATSALATSMDFASMSNAALLQYAEGSKNVDAAIALVQKRIGELGASGQYEGGKSKDVYAARAMNVLLERAQAGVPEAMYFVGLSLKSGYGLDENQSMGDNLIRGAAQRGNLDAKEILPTLGRSTAVPITMEAVPNPIATSPGAAAPAARSQPIKKLIRRY